MPSLGSVLWSRAANGFASYTRAVYLGPKKKTGLGSCGVSLTKIGPKFDGQIQGLLEFPHDFPPDLAKKMGGKPMKSSHFAPKPSALNSAGTFASHLRNLCAGFPGCSLWRWPWINGSLQSIESMESVRHHDQWFLESIEKRKWSKIFGWLCDSWIIY